MKESIMIFGGGEMQLSLIAAAAKLGYETVVIDPMENAPGREIAGIFYVIEPKDKEKTLQTAKKHSVKGIITTQMERPLLFMAEIAEDGGYIFPSKKAILNARNKYLMKKKFIEAGVPCAKGILFQRGSDLNEKALKDFSFPLIIKPVDAFSSRGVYLCHTFEDLKSYVNDTVSFSSDGSFLIEEFLNGPEVSVESVTQNGKTTIFQITDKEITPYPTAVEMAHIQPSALPQNIQREIREVVAKSITALELDNCGSHAELKITPNGVKMIEIGARLGGDFISSYLTENSTGFSIEEAAIQIAVGKPFAFDKSKNAGAVIRYLALPPGKKVRAIGDWTEVMKMPGVLQAGLTIKENDTILPITDSAKRPGYVIAQANSRDEAMKYAEEAISKMHDQIIYFD